MPLTDAAAITAALLRPLTDFETNQLNELIGQAETALRTRLANVDDRIESFALDPRPADAIDPAAVRRVLAEVIARKMSNPSGAASQTNSRADGPFSQSSTVAFASYGKALGDGTPGRIEITDNDVAGIVQRRGWTPRTIQLAVPGATDDVCAL